MKYNSKSLINNSRVLRKEMTRHERHLWFDFLHEHKLKWRRQYIISGYIVDFYSPQARLAIELDGSQHYEPANMMYDEKRTQRIEEYDIEIIRFSNLEIDRYFDSVCQTIDHKSELRLKNQ